jgi:hypothetical protein
MAMASGDDVLHLLQEAQTHFDFLMHDVEVRVARERLVFGNACLGAQAIVNVQEQVAGIAIPGPVADATLFLGVCCMAWAVSSATSAPSHPQPKSIDAAR